MVASASWEFHTIPIDFEVFKSLTARLESPHDSYNAVLRRLLGVASAPVTEDVAEAQSTDVEPWVVDDVVFPHGTEFRAKYKGKVHTGRVELGALVVNGERFASPSPAAISITHTSVNGWKFWECRRPGSSGWVVIDGLRKK